ncbi:Lipopolysaccharide-assembly [Tenacibaculum sp. MAR_2009_124]|uniref:LptE family protein n=1 Tax=Tenacibaculum sp. MAR_2009_124 TaxID=1250059 RepID=UPI0008943109|nr:LptE family protein [Tenacibaculum sp. MAR_2009_124]SED07742.1 Lipopolysaccharide-assembly [Tenacibaculum sp. MAR_2009_124]
MKKALQILFFSFITITLVSCGVYSFTGGDVGNAKTIQIDFFPNQAPIIEPALGQRFTQDLQDLFTRQTNLTLVSANGDLHFDGEIVDYRITPMSAQANQTAAQNRLTIVVNTRYNNSLDEKKNFEKQFSFYFDFDAAAQLTGSQLDAAFDEIIERITQDIFNASVGKW